MKDFNPKHVLLETLKKRYHIESLRGSDIVALNSRAILYIRYNKNAGATKNFMGRFWFGITKSEYDKYSNQNLFIVCACVFGPEKIDYLVFPADTFDEIKKDIELHSGQWKFNLLKTNEKKYLLQVSQKGKYDVTEFVNYFDFSPREFRRAYSPELGEFQDRVTKKEEIPAAPPMPVSLEDELLATAKDSINPKNFELALERVFTEIGFRCKRVSGPRETDILVLEPVRFIVDGKSTKADSKSGINFTRIKRHMKENRGEFMVVVSVGFDPAVGRDAEMEGATLIDIETLITILRIHREHVLSPLDYIELFRQPGLIGHKEVSLLQERLGHERSLLNKSLLLLENLDFAPRNIDEIKGRVDVYCEQRGIAKIERAEIESFLIFLSHELLKVVAQEDNKYSLRFTPPSAREKLKSIIRMLISEQFDGRNER